MITDSEKYLGNIIQHTTISCVKGSDYANENTMPGMDKQNDKKYTCS